MCMTLTVKSFIGHIPIELSFIINGLFQTYPNNFIIVEITGPRRLQIGLVNPGKFMASTKSAAGNRTKIKRTVNARKRTLQAPGDRNNWKWLTGKKQFSCTDAAVVKAWKVINQVAI